MNTIEERMKEVMAYLKLQYSDIEFDYQELGKYYRIHQTLGHQKCAYCFVAKEDNETKALGIVKRGDILKCAGWSAPAKHARGNIFDYSNTWICFTRYGVVYLK